MAIKAIETVYNGYRFRSRLEARWAVFFDTLGIEYEYEPEGFDLDGLWYLPDFWLPEQAYWIEIKPDHPTCDEMEKASRLAQGLNVNVFIVCGEPWAKREQLGQGDLVIERKYGTVGFFGNHRLMADHDGLIGYLHGWGEFERLHAFLHLQEPDTHYSKPIPEYAVTEQVVKDLIERDKEYFLQKHGIQHWRWKYGDWTKGLSCENGDCALVFSKEYNGIRFEYVGAHPDYNEEPLATAYLAARQARFEHGESG